MIIIFTCLLALIARAEPVALDIEKQKLFRLEFEGHRSHLLALPDVELEAHAPEIANAYEALTRSCEVFLRGESTLEKSPAVAEPVVLAKVWPGARPALRALGLSELFDGRRPVDAFEAWQKIRGGLTALRGRLAQLQSERVAAADAIDLDFAINGDLELAAEQLIGELLTPTQMLDRAGEWGARVIAGREPRRINFNHLAQEHAEKFDLKVSYLDVHTPAPPHAPDLHSLLVTIDALLVNERPLEVYVNEIIGVYLESVLAGRYFNLDAQTFAIVQGAMAYSGQFAYSNLPGESDLDKHEANAHEHWVGPIMAALAKHPTFIAVHARHILPGHEFHRRRSLLELLQEKGVTVTPIAARGHRPTVVK